MSSDPADLDQPGCPCGVPPVLALHQGHLHLWIPLAEVLTTLTGVVAEVYQLGFVDASSVVSAFTLAEVYRYAEADAWAIACPGCGLVFLGSTDEEPTAPWSTPSELVFPPDRPFF